jgi:DNA helicase-2/ATP-dependent DNA helicase PcrA
LPPLEASAKLESVRDSHFNMPLLDDLNPKQREAALATEGPVLVLAGAGTGKTRVVTYRIAHLIETGVPGDAILAVTFTNKAADEMRERVATLLLGSGKPFADPWIYTFHAFCARLLRREAPRLGLPRDFAIYDDDDQTAAVKRALEQLGVSDSSERPRAILERISSAKNHGETPDAAAESAGDDRARAFARIYAAYEGVLRRAGALDFDDLLLRAVQVLGDFPEARAAWSSRFRYVLVDEYQDTNRAQFDLLRLLLNSDRNLCVVGDEDQSIYRWRGADVGNILRFAENFPGAQVVRLEQNYRSTQNILDAAAGVVQKNQKRLGKTLEATRGAGNLLAFYEARDAKAEAEFVSDRIAALLAEDSSAHAAVLYRTNAQSRAFEEALLWRAIRYRMLGGFSFYQRAEVKDVLAYARLAIRPDDDVALLRVLNTPPRGIGKVTLDALRGLAHERNISLWAASAELAENATAQRSAVPLRGFRELIEQLRQDLASLAPKEFLSSVIDRSGYLDMLSQRDSVEDSARADNVRELLAAVAEGADRGETLTDFLERAALVSDADNFDSRATVTLLTLHSAKGLEFEHVFLTGLEEGVFPHSRSANHPDDIEEERRLCYVGMTRARDTLTLTRAIYRRIYGNERLEGSLPSRFLAEIPGELIEAAPGSLADAGETRRYEPDPEYSYSAEEFARRARRPAPTARSARSASSAPAWSPSRSAAASRAASSNPFVGRRVRHPKYGTGTIVAVEGDDEDRKLTVRFSDYGVKILVERYAQLVWA